MTRSSSLGFTTTGQGNPDVLRHHLPASQVQLYSQSELTSSTIGEGVCTTLVVPRRTLTLWNAAMFLFHTALATVTLVFGSQTLTVPVYKTVLEFVREGASGDEEGPWRDEGERPWRLIPSMVESNDLGFTNLVASFFILSALFHLGNATAWRSYYLQELCECRTPTRWMEYFFSAPVMILLIAYTLGIRDRSVLFACVVLIATTMPFGYWTEVVSRPRNQEEWSRSFGYRILPWAIGHVPQIAAWAIIIVQFYDGTADPDAIPAFVHVILWAELVLFFSFGGAALLSQWYPPKYFYRGELVFQVLSLVSKGLLGILMITNVLMLSRFEELYD